MNGAAARRVARRPTRRAADEDLARFFHGLSDPTRVRILRFLLDGPKSAGEIVGHIGRHQPTVSTHLTCLRFCGHVEARRQGRSVVYEVIDDDVRRIITLGERYLEANDERIRACQVIAAEVK
ncbi:MAG: winged helix-turn-helix transcriptional regulator [Chloroflexi bacterium]|nr:winged helix-turn-helix transcriptional regulator [Chloroflexota bacterium]